MKKLLPIFYLVVVIFYSCTQTQKVTYFSPSQLKGNWILSSIDYSKEGNYKSTLFNDSNKECFVGSKWNLIANNYSGEYVTNSSSNCQSSSRSIVWDVFKSDGISYFQFKRKIEDVKAKEIQSGYRLKIESIDENTIKMSQNTIVDNQPLQLNYTFNKTTN